MKSSADTLLEAVTRELQKRRLPEATYRLQFHAGFTFQDARKIVDYLHSLGVTHVYASPYLKARPGSTHGYDIVDHNCLNPEIGTEEEHASFSASLLERGMGQIVDVVPNHMGILGNVNRWWNDVLENGPASPYADYFDIAWQDSPRQELRGRVLLPALGAPYGEVLETQQLQLQLVDGAFSIRYFEHVFPIAPRSYAHILSQGVEELKSTLPEDDVHLLEYQSIITAARNLPTRDETDPEKRAERQREKEVIKRRLTKLLEESPAVAELMPRLLTRFNGVKGQSASFDLLDELLSAQAYRLSWWRVASNEINYRRFFDVNELAAVTMERQDVFDATHQLLFRLIDEGKVHGLRIDHVDGLYEPRHYLERLQRRHLLGVIRRVLGRPEFAGEDHAALLQSIEPQLPGLQRLLPLYVVVEKILGTGEQLPDDWGVFGTTGYEFLNAINALFVDVKHVKPFTQVYHDWIGDEIRFRDLVFQKKTLVLQTALTSELQMLSAQLDRLAQKDRWSRDFTLIGLRQGIRGVIASFPVYRTYLGEGEPRPADRRNITRAIHRARVSFPTISRSLFDFIGNTLLGIPPRPDFESAEYRAEQRHFAGRFQQLTPPVMAKGLEDTVFYVYNRLLSLNEVGGDPERFGAAPRELHRFLQERRDRFPWSLSTSSTHDTKRGEDTRARLNVLSEMPQEWRVHLSRWARHTSAFKAEIDDLAVPDANEEIFLYQTLLGAWPLGEPSPTEFAAFKERIVEYVNKALAEAKEHTSWINPNPVHVEAVQQFVARLLDPQQSPEFHQDFLPFVRYVSRLGLFNSLAQTVLKIASPGVPDVYQGTELWDFSLVDPDNRRPVDYEQRRRLLSDLDRRAAVNRTRLADELVENLEDPRIKLYVLSRLLRFGRAHPYLLTQGDYAPLDAEGEKSEHAFALVRRNTDTTLLIVVPRLIAQLLGEMNPAPLGAVWGDTALPLPNEAPSTWSNLFTGEEHVANTGRLSLRDVFAHFPVAALVRQA
jgi:(1->4)-alpha-D-glucan 1-alpha-D-glucosylmutase